MSGYYTSLLLTCVGIAAPILGVAMAAGLAPNLLQVGFLFTTKALAPKFERINPLKGFQRMFSMQTLVQLIKSLLKVIVLGYIFYNDYRALLLTLPGYIATQPFMALRFILETAFTLALKMSLAMAVIAAADFLYQYMKFEKDLRMTKQEVKDEYKLTEGDPQIKGRIRQKQRQMSMMRMMSQVPQADVVITNPTHFAVALQYTEGQEGAPRVLAKGQDYMARRIKEVAREHRIQIIENKPLAQTLYRMCEVGQEIPETLYQAVAEVLVYVYRQRRARPRPQPPVPPVSAGRP
jgi:flagellar biosynthetic protein FlhB